MYLMCMAAALVNAICVHADVMQSTLDLTHLDHCKAIGKVGCESLN